jgi:hypothetical protein
MWLGSTVLAVTLLIELSTTSLGERPGASTSPNFPTAALEYSFELRNDTRYIRKGDQAILSQRCHVEP